jgi:hypothetical protein
MLHADEWPASDWTDDDGLDHLVGRRSSQGEDKCGRKKDTDRDADAERPKVLSSHGKDQTAEELMHTSL